jgi:hypothetical protein
VKFRILVLAFLLMCTTQILAHEGDVEPPSKGFVLVSLLIASGGAVIVTLTLLAILWKPIDAAFRRSRFCARWERRSTRVGFAVGAIVLAGVAVGTITYIATRHSDHELLDAHDSGVPEPENGGVIKIVSRFGLELLLRRTGEVRLYITTLNGETPSAWDIKASVNPTKGFSSESPTNAVPLKLNANSSYLVSVLPPPEKRQAGLHLSLAIKQDKFEVDFDMPVQD